MWYGDYTPSSNYSKKPLSKKQQEKMKETFRKWAIIAEQIKSLEQKEFSNDEEAANEKLNTAFL